MIWHLWGTHLLFHFWFTLSIMPSVILFIHFLFSDSFAVVFHHSTWDRLSVYIMLSIKIKKLPKVKFRTKQQQKKIPGWGSKTSFSPCQRPPFWCRHKAFEHFIPEPGAPHWAVRCGTLEHTLGQRTEERKWEHKEHKPVNSLFFVHGFRLEQTEDMHIQSSMVMQTMSFSVRAIPFLVGVSHYFG